LLPLFDLINIFIIFQYVFGLVKREIWQYQQINYEKFEEKLNEINWNEKLDHLNDVDEMCEKFTKYFLKITKECIPTKIVTI
jgi:hypothetical protein